MLAFIVANYQVMGGALILILSGVSILLHMAHKDDIAAVLDKVVALEKQVGIQPPQA